LITFVYANKMFNQKRNKMKEITAYYVSIEDGRKVYARRRFTDKCNAVDFARTYAETWCKKHSTLPVDSTPEFRRQILHICLSNRSKLYCNVEQCTEQENGLQAQSTFGNF